MNPLQKQLVAGDGQLFMDKPDLTGKVRPREFYYGSPPAPQKVTVEEFEKTAMNIGREMHEAINWEEFEKMRAARQSEDRIHNPPKEPTVVWIDAENMDGKVRALLADKSKILNETIIVIQNPNLEQDEELKKLILGTHPMQRRRPVINMPTEFLQEHMNEPPDTCRCEFDPYDDGDTEPSTHFKRTCLFCGGTWFGLHCPHDGHQRPCPNCGKKPIPVK
jgi:hypothetical protein